MNKNINMLSSSILLAFMLIFFYMTGNAQTNLPVYEHLSIPKPAGLPHFGSSVFKIDPARLNLYPDGFLFGDRQVLDKLCPFLQREADGIRIWKEATAEAAIILNQWDFNKANFGFNRYVYSVFQLENLSLIYLFSGHKELGQFIRGHVLQITELPYEFWLHAELRGFEPSFPKGGLETAAICNALTMSISAARDLFSDAERTRIERTLKEKGLIPCVNWLTANEKSVNNWLAVVSSATYHTAKYFREKEKEDYALSRMLGYINNSFETDGSYGEGIMYFDYPVKSMLLALLAMRHEDRLKHIASSGLRYSASWRAYPLLLSTKGDNKSLSLHFGDNSYNNRIDASVGAILTHVYRNPVAPWLMNVSECTYSLKDMLLVFSESTVIPEVKSPGQAGLPLVKSFKGGDSYIRSSWENDGIVLSMWSGSGSLVDFAHQRPEYGSICMGAYGEYLIVSPGSASYRSDLRYQWDITTKAANTITIDDKNQIFPDRPVYGWNKTDVSGFWVTGNPKSEILQCRSGEIADLLVNEMALAYHVPMKNLRRSVLFVKDPGYFIIIDKIEAKEDAHKYSWRIHLNNRDGEGKIECKSPNHWFFSRPFANLDIYLFSEQEINIQEEKGYMHGPNRDYSPGGPNEGTLGSSTGLVAHNVQKVQSMMYYSVIFPTKKGTAAPKVSYKKNIISVGDDIVILKEGECTISQKEKTEKYNLWE